MRHNLLQGRWTNTHNLACVFEMFNHVKQRCFRSWKLLFLLKLTQDVQVARVLSAGYGFPA